MSKTLVRPFLILLFLIATGAVYTVWSQVGGQYHLDYVFWVWKLLVGLGAATVITLVAGRIIADSGEITGRTRVYFSLLIVLAIAAGLLSWYAHQNEPTDDEQDAVDTPTKVTPL